MKNKAAVALGRMGGKKNTPLQLAKRRENMAHATAERVRMRAELAARKPKLAAEIYSEITKRPPYTAEELRNTPWPEKKIKKKS